MTTVIDKYYTVDEYLEFEKTAEVRHEYVDGILIEMPGESKVSNEIAINLCVELKKQLDRKLFKLFMQDVKLGTVRNKRYRYPDLMVVDATDHEHTHIAYKAILVVEITSESTIATDYTTKLHEYSGMSSVEYYLIISQKEPLIEFYSRTDRAWEYTSFTDLQDKIELPKIGVIVSLSDIYEGMF